MLVRQCQLRMADGCLCRAPLPVTHVRTRHRGSFILTSNRSPKDWYEFFPNPMVAESVLDRLIDASFHVHMEGKSHRPRRRPGRSKKLVKGGGKG